MTTNLVILQAGESNDYPNQCVSGFIRNIGAVSGSFLLLQTSGKTLSRILAPLQSYNFQNFYIKNVKNTGTTELEIELSNSTIPQSSITIQQLDIGTISGTVNINGNVTISGTADVNITNSTLNVNGTVNINGIVDVSIQNTTVNVSGSVSISNSTLNITGIVSISSGSITVANSTLNISGIVSISNATVTISGSVNITNTTVNIGGIVSISSGSITVSNSTLNISGIVSVSSGSITIANSTVNISISSSIQLPTDIGNYTQSLQENQTNATNILTYNPWGFSIGTAPAVRVGSFNNIMANVQRNGANGYPVFFFYAYNPLTTTGSTTITVNLYKELPTNGFNTPPINTFNFSSGTLNPSSGAWITVVPNINWEYNSLVVVLTGTIGTTGPVIGIAEPNTENMIDSHYWNNTNWNFDDYGFCGFWQIINAAPASLPVSVTNPIQISSGNAQVASTTSTSQVIYTVPNGKKWKLLSILMGGGGNGGAVYATLIKNGTPGIINGVIAFNGGWEDLLHVNGATVTTTTYIGIAGITTPTNEGGGVATQSQQWNAYPILFAGDAVAILNELVNPWSGIWYEEENI